MKAKIIPPGREVSSQKYLDHLLSYLRENNRWTWKKNPDVLGDNYLYSPPGLDEAFPKAAVLAFCKKRNIVAPGFIFVGDDMPWLLDSEDEILRRAAKEAQEAKKRRKAEAASARQAAEEEKRAQMIRTQQIQRRQQKEKRKAAQAKAKAERKATREKDRERRKKAQAEEKAKKKTAKRRKKEREQKTQLFRRQAAEAKAKAAKMVAAAKVKRKREAREQEDRAEASSRQERRQTANHRRREKRGLEVMDYEYRVTDPNGNAFEWEIAMKARRHFTFRVLKAVGWDWKKVGDINPGAINPGLGLENPIVDPEDFLKWMVADRGRWPSGWKIEQRKKVVVKRRKR
jgi:DNA repair exonuclease SbcCD ATPase subunit